MIVETSYMAPSGEGTPMFSRRGKSTSVQYMVFNTPNMIAESSFKKAEREKGAMGGNGLGGYGDMTGHLRQHSRISNDLDTIFE